jgi:hypothetical protein
MRHTSAFSCDVCGRAKGAVNHWWIISPARAAEVEQLVISAWNDDLAADPVARHSCGNGCTQKMVERWLATGSLEAARSAVGDTA